jgi:hypothetical protein
MVLICWYIYIYIYIKYHALYLSIIFYEMKIECNLTKKNPNTKWKLFKAFTCETYMKNNKKYFINILKIFIYNFI